MDAALLPDHLGHMDLADVLTGEWNLRFAAGTTIQLVPVRTIEIPVPSLEGQRAIHAAISKAREARQLAARAY